MHSAILPLPVIFPCRAVDVVDALKARLTDPCITCHWSSIGSDTNTLATVHITSPEVGHLARLVKCVHNHYTPNSKMADSCNLTLDASFPCCSPQIIPSDRHFGIRCILYTYTVIPNYLSVSESRIDVIICFLLPHCNF